MNDINRADSEILEMYLKDLDSLLKDVSVSVKIGLLAEIRNHLTDFKEEKGLSMQEVLAHFGDKVSLINYFMVKYNLPPIKVKVKKSKLKYFFLVILTMFTVAVIFLVIVIKSFLPIFDFNDEESTLTFFGRKIVLERTGATFSQRFGQLERKEFPFEIKGEISSESFSELNVLGEIIDFAFVSTTDNNFKYDCFASQTLPSPVTKEGESLKIKFTGETKCMLYLPEGIKISGNMEQGYIDFKNMRQDIEISLGRGTINWRQDSFELYNLDANVVDGKVIGNVSKFKNKQAIYSGTITIDKGSLRLR